MSSMQKTSGSVAVVLSLLLFPLAFVLALVLGSQQQCAAGNAGVDATAPAGPTPIVGDSLSHGAEAQLKAKMAGSTVNAVSGQPWSWGLDKVTATSGQVQAYLLDTNGGVTPAQINALLAAHPGVRFVLMTISTPLPYTAATNAAVLGAQRAHPTMVFVADWHTAVARNPRLLGSDRVHPSSAAGWQAFADVVAAAVAKASPVSHAGNAKLVAATSNIGPSKPGDHHYTQTQLQSAVAKYDPQQALALGAIAMAETSGWNWPTHNNVAGGHWYHGPWAFQDATLAGLHLDANQLDGNLDYAAKAAADLAKTGITHGKWETWPTMAAKFMPGGSAFGQAQAVSNGPVLASAQTSNCTSAVAFTGTSVKGPGGGMTGNWAPGVYQWAKLIHDKFHVTVSTYPGHQPDEVHAIDIAVGQFGNDWSDGSPGHPGNRTAVADRAMGRGQHGRSGLCLVRRPPCLDSQPAAGQAGRMASDGLRRSARPTRRIRTWITYMSASRRGSTTSAGP